MRSHTQAVGEYVLMCRVTGVLYFALVSVFTVGAVVLIFVRPSCSCVVCLF